VTETLAGRGERLSERTVARRALHRAPDFDGKADASVRVQASRVRKSLEEYYATEGAADPVRIALPRGSYIPVFVPQTPESGDAAVVPGVVVASLASSGDEPADAFARSMTESLVQHLAAHGHIRVVGPIEGGGNPARSAAAASVGSILTGHVAVRDQQLSMTLRLHDADSSEVLWSDEQYVDIDDLAGFEVEQRWAQEIAATVGDPAGPVIRMELSRDHAEGAAPELAGRLAFYAYLHVGSLASVERAIAALDAALEEGSRTPTVLSMRAAMANTWSVYDLADREAELDRAESLAREALRYDAGHVHAMLVLAYPLLQRGHVDVAVELAEKVARLAPYQPFYLATAGMALVVCGEWERGAAHIRESLRLNPGQSGQTYSWLVMSDLALGDYERALAEAAMLPAEGDYLWGPLFRSLALAGVGYLDQARAELEKAREMRPEVVDDVAAHLSGVFRMTPEELARIVGLLDELPPAVPAQRAPRSAASLHSA
jgi:tetratricopeptide (TPR) repeat protein